MALNIKDPEADALARKLAARTGETLTEAVLNAIKERLERTENARKPNLRAELAAIRARCSSLPILDARTAEDILGYDNAGLPR